MSDNPMARPPHLPRIGLGDGKLTGRLLVAFARQFVADQLAGRG